MINVENENSNYLGHKSNFLVEKILIKKQSRKIIKYALPYNGKV